MGMLIKKYFPQFLVLVFLSITHAQATEERFITSADQGISTPSFWNAIKSENPAGLVLNQTVKLQIGAGSYNGTSRYTSGGLLMGNGIIGAGVEYQNSNLPNKINWGIAGRLQGVATAFGLASHTTLEGGGTVYDAGMIIEPIKKVRLGFMLPHFNTNLDSFTGGLAYLVDEDTLEVIVDADYNSTFSNGVIKPGVGFHSERIHAAEAYGLRYLGDSTVVLNQGLSLGLGAKVTEYFLVSYEYRAAPEHRLGLTLRFN